MSLSNAAMAVTPSYDRDVDCPAGSASSTCNSMGNGYAGDRGFLKRFLTDGL